jgi:hypothetical protein
VEHLPGRLVELVTKVEGACRAFGIAGLELAGLGLLGVDEVRAEDLGIADEERELAGAAMLLVRVEAGPGCGCRR